LARALEQSRIRGLTTNRDFLVEALRHPTFLTGAGTTAFIETSGVALSRVVPTEERRFATVAAALFEESSSPALHGVPKGWRNSVMPPERRTYDDVEVSYRLRRDGAFDFGDMIVVVYGVEGGWVDFAADGQRHRRHVFAVEDRVWVQGPDGDVALRAQPRFPEPEGAAGVEGGLVAPMPGKVVSVAVTPGDSVDEGQLLMILEAMKMEHRVLAPHAGVVSQLRAGAGEQVNGGDILVVLE
jgi:propionyl-CoA carboxylase alpha chain